MAWPPPPARTAVAHGMAAAAALASGRRWRRREARQCWRPKRARSTPTITMFFSVRISHERDSEGRKINHRRSINPVARGSARIGIYSRRQGWARPASVGRRDPPTYATFVGRGLQRRRINRITASTGRDSPRDFRRAEQRPTIGGLAAFRKRARVGKRPLRCRKTTKTPMGPCSPSNDRRALNLSGKIADKHEAIRICSGIVL